MRLDLIYSSSLIFATSVPVLSGSLYQTCHLEKPVIIKQFWHAAPADIVWRLGLSSDLTRWHLDAPVPQTLAKSWLQRSSDVCSTTPRYPTPNIFAMSQGIPWTRRTFHLSGQEVSTCVEAERSIFGPITVYRKVNAKKQKAWTQDFKAESAVGLWRVTWGDVR